MLAHVPGYVAVGELENIWARGFRDNQLCSCGSAFQSCDFWTEVTREAFGGYANVPRDAMSSLIKTRNRIRSIPPSQFRRLRTADFESDLGRFQDSLRKLHTAILAVSGAEVIVDSSKSPSYGFLLATMDDLLLSVIHLIRDSRAVAYSWQKVVRRPEVIDKAQYMGGFRPLATAKRWDVKNILSEALRTDAVSYTRMRYEDLTAHPAKTLKRALDIVDPRRAGLLSASLVDETVPLPRVYHTVSGNPIRLDRGDLRIRPDIEWHTGLGRRNKTLVTFLTVPLLLRYRYPLV